MMAALAFNELINCLHDASVARCIIKFTHENLYLADKYDKNFDQQVLVKSGVYCLLSFVFLFDG